jgi:hypothetical protein
MGRLRALAYRIGSKRGRIAQCECRKAAIRDRLKRVDSGRIAITEDLSAIVPGYDLP